MYEGPFFTKIINSRKYRRKNGTSSLLIVYFQVTNKAMELGIFELLYQEKNPISAEDLAKKNKFKPNILARLLNCLTAIKLVTKTKENGKGIKGFYRGSF